MALPTSRRRRLEVEALEHRYAPSTSAAAPLHGSIQLTPSARSVQPNSGGITVFTGTATVTGLPTGTLKGTFSETIRPFHAHGHAELTLSGNGVNGNIQLLENFKPASGATQAVVGLHLHGRFNHPALLGQATGHTNFATGAAQLNYTTSPIQL